MDTYETMVAPNFVVAADAGTVLNIPFLVLGGTAPKLSGISCRSTPSAPCAGILMLGPVTPAQLAGVLIEVPDPAVPIADFAGNRGLRCDFAGEQLDPPAIIAFRELSIPIWRRLAELPFRAVREDRAELTLLRIAYSRDAAIKASFAPDSSQLVDYRLLGRISAARQRLEALADLDLLRRQFFTRTHACGRCQSARLHAYEACPACGGGNLVDEPIVHHYRCGSQAPESLFVDGRLLVCPKCRRVLRHFGVDYGKPGIAVVCRGCDAVEDEPVANFACLDCAAVTPSADSSPTDWYHYELTEEGLRALHDGQLPRLNIAPVLQRYGRAFSPREFSLLVAEALRVARRYDRPFALARVTVANIDPLRRELGPVAVDNAFRLAIDACVGLLRDSDFVTPSGSASMLIGFPETSAALAAKVLGRIKKEVAVVVAAPLEIAVTIAEGERAGELLDGE
jgi:Thaumarchaeal output domain 1